MKKYKNSTPEETISKIRSILDEIGILLMERHFIASNHYSCRVTIGNEDMMKLNIGTNGKGRSFEYSLASGYAEFAERLQNNLLLDGHKMLTDKTFGQFSFANESKYGINFQYDPIEKEINPLDFDEVVKHEIKKICQLPDSADIERVFPCASEGKNEVCVPFYDVKSEKEVWFPIDWILQNTGSNGMASGNTPKEAILQAVCEVFERYVIRQIYYSKVTPPEIPLSEYEGSAIYDRLMEYKEKTGHDIIIRDCSLGLGIPAVGLVIIDHEHQFYNFKIGVDFVPEIALERCFTETFQGRSRLEELPFRFTDFNNEGIDSPDALEENLMKVFVNGTGYWPSVVVFGTPSYAFSGFNPAYGQSNKNDIDICLKILDNLGHSLYVRDNSYLGFPTYFVLIPGMSEITESNPLDTSKKFTKTMLNLEAMNHLGRVDTVMAASILEGIEDNYQLIKSEDFKLKHVFVYNVNEDLCELDIDMLTALLAYYLGDVRKCIKYLTNYLKNKDKRIYKYFYACLDYLKVCTYGDKETALKAVSTLYGGQTAVEVKEDFSDNLNIFQYYKLPNCPNCSNCKLASECREKEVLTIKTKIRQKQVLYSKQQIMIREDLTSTED